VANAPIHIEPVVSYPRTARPGERHYLTVDVRHQHPPDQWPYGQEELALTCLVDTALFSHEPLGDQKVVLHRFGGSYGPAAFLLTAREKLQKGGMTLSFVNRFGMAVHTVVLKDIEITDAPAPAEAPRIQVPVSPPARRGDRPAAEWVSFSGDFTPEQVRKLQGDLEAFRAYLRSHEVLEPATPPVRVRLSSEQGILSWYDPRERTMSMHPEMLVSRDALFHEYAHHVLLATGEGRLLDEVEHGIECGLADYLTCSFTDNPHFGEDLIRVFGFGRNSLRDLDNRLHVSSLPPRAPPQSVGEIWGGAFWELRGEFSAQVIDVFLAQAWRERGRDFQAALLKKALGRSFRFFVRVRRPMLTRGLLDMETVKRVERAHRELIGKRAGLRRTAEGRRAVSASNDKTLKVWDLETGHAVATLEGHSGVVRGCAVTADGRRAVSASSDGTLKVWDLETGHAVATLEGHSDIVWSCAVTADGRRAVSASEDKTLKVWDLETFRAPHEEQRWTAPDTLLHRPEEEELFSLLTRTQARTVIRLQGYFGQGVTTVMKRMAQRLEHSQPPRTVLWFDATRRGEDGALEFRNVEALTKAVERALRQERRAGASRQQRTVVIIDNLHDLLLRSFREEQHPPTLPSMPGAEWEDISLAPELPWGMASIRRLLKVLEGSANRALMAIRPDTPYLSQANVYPGVSLRDLGAEQMKQLAGLHGVSLSDAGAWALIEWTGGRVRLATLLLEEARRQRWTFEDLMRFEGEEWSCFLDDSEVARVRSLLARAPELERELRRVAEEGEEGEVYWDPHGRLARGLEGAGLIRHRGEGRWALRTPFYQRVFAPDAMVRLPEVFPGQSVPRGWRLMSGSETDGRTCRIRLVLSSKEPLPERIRFRLTPGTAKEAVVRKGFATVRFSVPAPFGPITAWAETLDGQSRLGTRIDRMGDTPPPAPKATPRPARRRKAAIPRRTADKRGPAKK
jgi:hypothetical protein